MVGGRTAHKSTGNFFVLITGCGAKERGVGGGAIWKIFRTNSGGRRVLTRAGQKNVSKPRAREKGQTDSQKADCVLCLPPRGEGERTLEKSPIYYNYKKKNRESSAANS